MPGANNWQHFRTQKIRLSILPILLASSLPLQCGELNAAEANAQSKASLTQNFLAANGNNTGPTQNPLTANDDENGSKEKQQNMEQAIKTFHYPNARRSDHTDAYHGVKVADPYRWLEDPRSQESRQWIDGENKVTRQFIDSIKTREAIKKRLTELWDFEKCGVPHEEAGKLFFSRNTGLQNQDVLFVQDTPESKPRVLIDPNTLSSDGTVALTAYEISRDGKYIAYSLSKAGSDWQEWYVRDIETTKDLDDKLEWVKFSGASWSADSKGFYYSAYDKPNEQTKLEDKNYFQKLYYHKLGTKQTDDKLVYQRKDQKEWGFEGSVTDDGKYLIIQVWRGTEVKNRVFYQDLSKSESPVVELLPDADAKYHFIGNDGSLFYFLTDLNAPKCRVVAIDTSKFVRAMAHQGKAELKEIVPESTDTLEQVSYVGDRFFARYLKDAFTVIKEFTTSGALARQIELPGIGTANGFGGRSTDTTTYYSYTSFNTPSVIYKYDIQSANSSIFFKPKVKFDPDQFVTEQVFVTSKDGTKVPLFVVHKKGVRCDGQNPTLLYGYGGFNIALRPAFSQTMIEWMEMGGVYAQACLRGGGEYGVKWHEAGMKKNKQNVFDDFIACGEWLIANNWTSKRKLAISGGSNGGLLVGACLTQRPDLFAAACPTVGVMDMLRFHKFTIGWAWTSDYGSADDDLESFKTLHAYSPLHNIKEGTAYPATLIITADHDDRVVPAHSFKFAAELQHANKSDNPILIRIETSAGHGAGKPTTKSIEEWSDKLAFLVKVLGFEKEAELALADDKSRASD